MRRNITVKQWVDALKSGEYNQTTETLSNGDSYCCLGVACTLADADANADEYLFMEVDGPIYTTTDLAGYTAESLEGAIKSEYRGNDLALQYIYEIIPHSAGRVPHNANIQTLFVWMNDTLECDFPTIAKAIEEILDPDAVLDFETGFTNG